MSSSQGAVTTMRAVRAHARGGSEQLRLEECPEAGTASR